MIEIGIAFAPERDRARVRGGGKAARPKLIRPVKPKGKRAEFIRWFESSPRRLSRSFASFIENDTLNLSRPNVVAYLFAINRDHGIGYTIADGFVTLIYPAGVTTAFGE